MFTSRHSEPRTVLLWGDRWHCPNREASDPFTHVNQAADILAARFADEPKPVRLRLIFQPDALESAPVACPQGDRRVLTAALGGDFPALTQPSHAWSHEPVMPVAEGFGTILHFEAQPALITLAAQLARLGLAVDSAWPLATFLHALPDEWTDTGAITVIAVRSESAVAYHHPAKATRSVLSWRGETALAEVGQWLARLLNETPGEPVLLICADEDSAAGLETYIGDDQRPGLEVLRLKEALGRRVVLPRYHPAQLLPREPVATAQSLAIAASVALFIAVGWAGFAFGREWLAARSETEARETRLASLRTEVAHLRQNAAEISRLRRLVEECAEGPPCGALLRALSMNLSPEIALASFRLDGSRFEIAGWIASSAPAGTLDLWRQQFAGPGTAWTVDLRPADSGAFTLTGAFRP